MPDGPTRITNPDRYKGVLQTTPSGGGYIL